MRCPTCGYDELEKRPYYITIDTNGLTEQEIAMVHRFDGVDYYHCQKCCVAVFDGEGRFKFFFHQTNRWYKYGVGGWTLIKNPIIDEKVIFT